MIPDNITKAVQETLKAAKALENFTGDPNDDTFFSTALAMQANSQVVSQYVRRVRSSVPLDKCEHGAVYDVGARNFNVAVFNKKTGGFIGIREKFGKEFLDTEYHWSKNDCGTACPYKVLEWCPVEIALNEGTSNDHFYIPNKELFYYLQEAVQRHRK